MKWFLVVMLFQGGVTYIPMDTREACLNAAHKIEVAAPNLARPVCIQQGE